MCKKLTVIVRMQVLRETMRNLLQVCLNRSVTSIAIPSLGAGKLGYPHNVVADILFTEVLGFNNQHPSFFKKIIFVLSENEIYETFMKVYVQRLHISSAKEVSYICYKLHVFSRR